MSQLGNVFKESLKKTEQYSKVFLAYYKANLKVAIPVSVGAALVVILAIIGFSHGSSSETKRAVVAHRSAPQPQKIDLKVALEKQRQKILALAAKQKQVSNDSYLKGINGMSMDLNYITLQNQLLKQKLVLAEQLQKLKNSGIHIDASLGLSGMGSSGIFTNQQPLTIEVIYKEGASYKALLKYQGSDLTVTAGTLIGNCYRVKNINSENVVLIDLSDNHLFTLSIQDQMRSI